MFLTDDQTLLGLLREDVPHGDLTTRCLGIAAKPASLTMEARGAMTVCCSEEAARIFQLVGAESWVQRASGRPVASGEVLVRAEGPAEALHAGWKVAQVLMEWASGLASGAAEIVVAARAVNPAVMVACTRKSVPGTRTLSLKAVSAGGAVIHRTGLSDTVLLFAEHRAFGGPRAMAEQIARLRQTCPERHIVVEVSSLDEAQAAAEAGADVLQLEKFTPAEVAATAAALGPGWPGKIAAAGGIGPSNAASYAAAGAQVLVTSMPYNAQPRDVAVRLVPA